MQNLQLELIMVKASDKQIQRKRQKAWFTFLRLAEGRSILELQSFYLLKPLLRKLPKGDGHSVIVIPGFLASDRSTKPLRNLLKDLDYDTHGWGLGRNVYLDQNMLSKLPDLLKRVYQQKNRRVSLIGWSLGGVFARELAKAMPEKVRCVISLGSPISGRSDHTNASNLFQALNGAAAGASRDDIFSYTDINLAPPVPTTSIYSKTDGIVYWKGSIQKEHPFPLHTRTENIELPASHLGLGVNSFAMIAVADRLAQTEDNWARFSPVGWRALFFRRPRQNTSERIRAIFNV